MLKASILLTFFSLFLFSFKNFKQTASAPTTEKSNVVKDVLPIDGRHVSTNSLDWQGDYSGALPCTYCDGIKTTLSLKKGKYTQTPIYLGRTDVSRQISGNIIWSKDGSSITLAGTTSTSTPAQYKSGRNPTASSR